MHSNPVCERCSRKLPSDAPDQLCPYCLLAVPGEPMTVLETARFRPPEVEELQSHFDSARLHIEALIGSGGMGAVYLASQPGLERSVALKILPPELAQTDGFSERFAREARVLARLDHANVVDVYDHGTAGPYSYLILEHVDGVNLRELIAGGVMRPEDAIEIIPQLCDALQYAHDHGIIHRDIKPENILVDTRGRVKITDFGLAKLVDPGQLGSPLTRTHQVMGTPSYMAPEQVEHPDRVDHRVDIYALGVVFYELLTGELPLGRFMPPSRKHRAARRLDKIVMKALEKEPEKRYEAASEVKSDVERTRCDWRRPQVRPKSPAAGASRPTNPVGATVRALDGLPIVVAGLHLIVTLLFYASAFFCFLAMGELEALGYLGCALVMALASRLLADMRHPPRAFQPLVRPPEWLGDQLLKLLERVQEVWADHSGLRLSDRASIQERLRADTLGLLITAAVFPIAVILALLSWSADAGLFLLALVFLVIGAIAARFHLRGRPQDWEIPSRRWVLAFPIVALLLALGLPALAGPAIAAIGGLVSEGHEIEAYLLGQGYEFGPVEAIMAAATFVVSLQFAWVAVLLLIAWQARRPLRWLIWPLARNYHGRGIWLATLISGAIAVLCGTATWWMLT